MDEKQVQADCIRWVVISQYDSILLEQQVTDSTICKIPMYGIWQKILHTW